MIAIGNDIVATGAIDIQRTIQKHFYAKILTAKELGLYPSGSMPFAYYVWLLWSIKEAAYKYYGQLSLASTFAPLRISVTDMVIPVAGPDTPWHDLTQAPIKTCVEFDGHLSYSNSRLSAHHITSFVHPKGVDQVYSAVRYIENTDHDHQSEMVRAFALAHLKTLYPGDHVAIAQNQSGIPYVYTGNSRREDLAISLSHHDHYVSYAFLKG